MNRIARAALLGGLVLMAGRGMGAEPFLEKIDLFRAGDDGGRTWRAGDIAVPCTEEWINPSESVAIELADGRVMLNTRNESRSHRRLVTVSPDGAAAGRAVSPATA